MAASLDLFARRSVRFLPSFVNKHFSLPLAECNSRCFSSTVVTNKDANKRTTNSRQSEKQTTSEVSAKGMKISQAMKAYLERAKSYDEFMKEELAEFEIGKRHLANIMSLDPDTITQEDINKSIEYLLPSALHDKTARPILKHPDEVIPQRKAAQFGMDGRPFHHMFYTGLPHYFEMMHEISDKIDLMKLHEDKMTTKHHQPDKNDQITLAGSKYIPKKDLEIRIKETVSEAQYQRWTMLMDRLAEQPYSVLEKDFIMNCRQTLATEAMLQDPPEPLVGEDGRRYVGTDGRRKRATASVTLTEKGTGKFTVNGLPILEYFPRIYDREQLLHPLQFTDTIHKMDIEASVDGGGPSGQSGAIRFAVSKALQSFVDQETVVKMRLAGLLSKDPRRKERQKPGQARARRKFTWKKR